MATGLFGNKKRTGNWVLDHSLSLTLAVILVIQTAYALWAGHQVWSVEGAKTNGPFWLWWTWEYNVSLVADTYGVILIVLLSKWLYEPGSDEGKDPGEG